MENVLQKPNSSRIDLLRTIDHSVHQLPTDARILNCRVNSDWSHASYHSTFVEEVDSKLLTPILRNERCESWVTQQIASYLLAKLNRGKVGRERMRFCNVCECFIKNSATRNHIIGISRSNLQRHIHCPPRVKRFESEYCVTEAV